MLRNYTLDSSNHIIVTQEFPFDESEPSFDFPDEFDFDKQSCYTLDEGALNLDNAKLEEYLAKNQIIDVKAEAISEIESATTVAALKEAMLKYVNASS